MIRVPSRWLSLLPVLSLSVAVVFAAGLACGQQTPPKSEEKTGSMKVEPAEKERLAARHYGRRHLMRLGCRENEDNVGRRLLQRFEQRIEG